MKLTLLAAAAVLFAPFAHAQDCGPLESVIAAGRDAKFKAIMGEPFDDGYFLADIAFFNADYCIVDSILPQYHCVWDTPSVAEADKAIAPLYDMAKVCLSDGWTWTDLAGEDTATGTQITEGYQMSRTRGPQKGAVVRVYMDSKPGQAWRQVWLEVE